MDLNDQLDSAFGGIKVNDEATRYLSEMVTWGQVIFGISVIFLLLAGFGSMAIFFGTASFFVILPAIFTILFTGIPAMFLYRFIDHTQEALEHSDSYQLAIALKNLKSLFKFVAALMLLFSIIFLLMTTVFGS